VTLLALRPEWMGALAPLGESLQALLGSGFLVLAAFVVLLGLEAFAPHQALALPQLMIAFGVMLLIVEVLADLAGGRGGMVGAWLAGGIREAIGVPGAWTVSISALLVDLQWMTRISLRGPVRILFYPFRLLTRLGRLVGKSAWQGYLSRREAAARERAAAPAFVAAPSVENFARTPQPDVETGKKKRGKKVADEPPAVDLFPTYTPPEPEPAPASEPAPSAQPEPARVEDSAFPDYPLPGEDAEEEIPPWDDDEAVVSENGEPIFDDLPEEIKIDEEPVEEEDIIPPPIWEAGRADQMDLFAADAFKPPVVYQLPPLELLVPPINGASAEASGADLSRVIVETLNSFGVATRIVNVEKGPTVTRYELQPARGVKVSKITSLNNDIALALAAQAIRIEAPIPGKSAIGIEVPNTRVDAVPLREIVESQQFSNGKGLMLALGKDISGRAVVADLLRMPHLLIAGATGSGKSVCLNTVIVSILYRATPKEVQMVMVDPKRVELSIFEGIPHLADTNVNPNQRIVKDAKTGTLVLKQACEIMNQRFELLSQNRVRNIGEYNAKATVPMPYLVIIVDELAQLMQISARSVEGYLQELAQMGRAAGIHLILATQRPSVDVLTGTIKSNFPARIAFAVSAQVDSRTILDRGGAEKLLGRGDMLFSPTDAELRRVQGALITLEETERVVDYWRKQEAPENLTPLSLEAKSPEELLAQGGESSEDEDLLREAVRIIRDTRLASASNLQRKLMIGYPRAARLVDELEARGFLGPANGSKPRKILFLEAE